MILIVAVVALSVAAGYLFGGRLRRFQAFHPRWWVMAPIGLALQLIPLRTTAEGGPAVGDAVLIASYVLLIAFAARNLRTMGFPLILAGLALNLAVIAPNGGMPVNEGAVEASGQTALLPDLRAGDLAKHHLMTSEDVLAPLSDRIPIGPPVRQVVSAGDVLIYAGLVLLVAAVMRGRTPAAVRASEEQARYRGKHRAPRAPAQA